MEEIIKFFEELAKFKETPRRGWVLRKVKSPESIADHNFRLLLFAWILPRAKNYKLDFDKLVRLILAHDLHRTSYGDDTPYDFLLNKGESTDPKLFEIWPPKDREDRVEKNFEQKREKLKKFLSSLPEEFAMEIADLWEEFEQGISKEAKFARQLDKLETLMQSIHYERDGESIKSYPFWREVKEAVDDPLLLKFMEEIDKYYYVSHKK